MQRHAKSGVISNPKLNDEVTKFQQTHILGETAKEILQYFSGGREYGDFFRINSSQNRVANLVTELMYLDALTLKNWMGSVVKGVSSYPERQEHTPPTLHNFKSAKKIFFGCPIDFAIDPPRSSFSGPYSVRRSVTLPSNICDLGNLYVYPNETNFEFGKRLAHSCWRNAVLAKQSIWVGGDHSLTYHAIEGITAEIPKIVVIQLDAHNDLGIYGKSKYLKQTHALNLASFNHANFARYLLIQPEVEKLIQIGVRPTEKIQREHDDSTLRKLIQISSDSFSLESIGQLISVIEAMDIPIYLSIDLDVIDPSSKISVTTPLSGGLSTENFLGLVSLITKSTAKIVGVDVVEHYESDCAYKRRFTDHLLIELFRILTRRDN